MFNAHRPATFTLSLPTLAHDLQVLAFTGTEALNQPYRFEVELVSERPDLALERLLHQPAFLAFDADGAGVHGQVYRVAQGESGRRLTRYHISLVPRLAYLAHARQPRIFQHLSVPDILAQVLEGHGILADRYRFQLGPTVYPPREYCTQYDETDLNFLQRLCAEEGLSYHFRHSADGHLLVFGDDQTVFPALPVTRYQQGTGLAAEGPVVSRFGVRLEARATEVYRRDYDFEQPHVRLESRQQSLAHGDVDDADNGGGNTGPTVEDYCYPGAFRDTARGRLLGTRALERHRSDHQLAEGQSDQPSLVSGHFLPLEAHPREGWNDLWLLTALAHEGRQPQVLEESIPSDTERAPSGFHQGYRNTFEATPWQATYRPPLSHQRHLIHGSQCATVTGPAGEEVFCDAYGRVKVLFPWHRDGQADEHSSCWLRVATAWAGNGYGSVAIPRVGMEVAVAFFDGDPDRPYVAACLPNALNPVPHALPEANTQSVFKTRSSPGGEGFNELRIEDRQGQEQIALHAERDLLSTVRHDHSLHIGHEQRLSVGANAYAELKGEEHRVTHGDRKVALKRSDHLDISVDQHVKAGNGLFAEAGREIHFKAGDKVVIEAGTELTLRVGGSFVKLDPSGVWVSGWDEGGAPGQGSGPALLAPMALNLPALTQARRASALQCSLAPLADKPLANHTLHSTFAFDQLTDLAQRSTPTEFTLLLVPIFGFDIPAPVYMKLHTALRDGTLHAPEHRVMDIGDYPASYDNATRTINVHHSAIAAAHAEPDAAQRLLAILLHEFGHHIDNVLRQDLADKHPDGRPTLAPDGPLDEGARYAYQIAFFDIANSHEAVYAHYTGSDYTGPLKVDYREAQAAIQRSQGADAQQQEDKTDSREHFGAGRGESHKEHPETSFGHQSVEDALERAGFDATERRAIYFGNWLRDHSQAIDIKIIRAPSESKDFFQKPSRETLTALIHLLSLKEFHSLYNAKDGHENYTVTLDKLGVYRRIEHIDNPKNTKPDPLNPKSVDPNFEEWVLPGDPLLDIHPKRSMKRYIRDSVKYMRDRMNKAALEGKTADGMRWFGEALHVLEDYFAHSNYVELSLRKMGYSEVLPWTGKAECKHGWPVVTGMFTTFDMIASVGPMIGKMIFPIESKEFEQKLPGERSDIEEVMAIVLKEHSDPEIPAGFEKSLKARDTLRKKSWYPDVAKANWAIGYPIRLALIAINLLPHTLVQLLADGVDDLQTLWTDNPNTSGSTDPTHSQLGKDHDNHPFHTLAAKLAGHAVEQVGHAMLQRWNGDATQAPAKLASSFICHPNDSTWQDELVAEWAKAHPGEISKGTSATDLEHLWKAHALPLIEDVKQMGEFGENGWNYIATYFEELFRAENQAK